MASRGVNKVIILGNLGQDPEVRYMQNGDPVATLNLATSETWRDKQTGEQREKTEWHRVVMFGKLAEVASQYLRKGSQVYIEGALQTRKWQDQQGIDRYTTEIVVQGYNGVMQMVGGRSAGGQGAPMGDMGMGSQMPSNTQNNFNQQPAAPQFSGANPNSAPNAEPPMDFDDDIPF